ncbi:hypothetical protein H1C71_035939 [Ictidomys tridecemlineatus]|nr:hypothetical protein H1C71_035939 [Ictidomys tridecemlineatus]
MLCAHPRCCLPQVTQNNPCYCLLSSLLHSRHAQLYNCGPVAAGREGGLFLLLNNCSLSIFMHMPLKLCACCSQAGTTSARMGALTGSGQITEERAYEIVRAGMRGITYEFTLTCLSPPSADTP